MRRQTPPAASLASLVALLFAAPVIAHAALATHSFGTSTSASAGPSVVNVAPTQMTNSQPAAPSSGTGSTASNTVIAPTNTTKTDQRAAATDQAVQPERSSANTSASQIRTATTAQPAATVSPTSGTTTSGGSATGTTGGTTTGGTTNGGTTATGGTATGTVVGSSLGFPGSVGTIVNSGEPTVDANGNIVASNAAYAVTPAATQVVTTSAPVYSSAEVAFADNTMNQVIGEAKRDRRRVGRNGQLLYSIAPRTNVDRSKEVPDDGPSPALTGPLAR